MRRFVLLVLAVAGVALLAGERSHAGFSSAPVQVYFTDGEDVYAETRVPENATLHSAMQELLAGPSAKEHGQDVRTWIPHGTQLRSARIANGIARVDLGHRFLRRAGTSIMRARLVEVAYTATQFHHAHHVKLLVDGKPLKFLGSVRVPHVITRHDVDPPQKSLLTPTSYVKDRQGPETGKTKRLQRKLIELGYLPPGAATGHYGPQTTQAVMAFQGWEGIARDGDAGPQTFKRLATAARPEPKPGSGKRAQVFLRRQVLLLVRGSRVVRAIHISSGAPGTSTPAGSFKVYRKARKDWSYPFKVWLQWVSYFTGGIAFHEYPDVPPYPASHGCVRVPRDDSVTVYRFATLGTPVTVYRS